MGMNKKHIAAVNVDQESIKHAYQAAFYNWLDHVWVKLPGSIGTILATVIIFLAGITMKSEWLIILVHFIKQTYKEGDPLIRSDFSSEKFKNLHLYLLNALTVSCVIYFGLCGFLQWYFYIRQRDTPEKMEMSTEEVPHLEGRKIGDYFRNIQYNFRYDNRLQLWITGAIVSGFLTCHVMNNGYTTIYFDISEYGIMYFLLSVPAYFIHVDVCAYYIHRTLHLPFFYKKFHKLHHVFKQPTPFSASAMHPVEFLWIQSSMMLPIFLVPIHWAAYLGVVGYVFYYGIIDHSGIEIDSIWPWQPSSTFHDNHHEYFHVNFGFNTAIWDKLHGTCRVKGRIYNEKIFYGRGKSLDEATPEEIAEQLQHES